MSMNLEKEGKIKNKSDFSVWIFLKKIQIHYQTDFDILVWVLCRGMCLSLLAVSGRCLRGKNNNLFKRFCVLVLQSTFLNLFLKKFVCKDDGFTLTEKKSAAGQWDSGVRCTPRTTAKNFQRLWSQGKGMGDSSFSVQPAFPISAVVEV